MIRILVLCAAAAAAEEATAAACGAGRKACPVPPEDEDPSSSLGLLQRSLGYTRALASGNARADTASKKANAPGQESNKTATPEPCLLRLPAEESYLRNLPGLTPGAHAELEGFKALGLLSNAPMPKKCVKEEAPSLLELKLPELMAGASVEDKNTVAFWTVLIWFSCAVGVVIWAVVVVACVPRKREWERGKNLQMKLADEDTAWQTGGVFHWLSLSWADSLMGRYGKCMNATVDDSEVMIVKSKVENAEKSSPYLTLKKCWREEVEAKGMEKASLVAALYKSIGARACVIMVSAVFVEVAGSMVGMVMALDIFLGRLEKMGRHQAMYPNVVQSLLEPTILVIVMLFGIPMLYRTASILVNLLDGHYSNFCSAGLASLVFEKAMSLPVGVMPQNQTLNGEDMANMSPEEQKQQEEEGKAPNVIQLLNLDIIECWGYLLKLFCWTCFAPFVALVLFVMLIKKIHMAGFIGFLYCIPCLVLVIGAQLFTIKWWQTYQSFQDTRLKTLTETMLNIRVIKSLSWEGLSYEKLSRARESELAASQKTIIIGGLVGAFMHTMPWFSMLIALFYSLRMNGGIRAHEIIVIQRIMMSLLTAIGMFAAGLRKFTLVPNSFNRIKRYLAQADRPKDAVKAPMSGPNAPGVRVLGSFSFTNGAQPVLHDLNIAIPQGELVGIIGEVASGKSALLQTLIGELYPVKGACVEAPQPGTGRIAYCSQTPWIFEGTLRENVLLKSELDEDRYHRALYAAALTQDLQILPGGDQVTIGSFGIRLSGGQRARVALARAAYMEQAEVVVMDDPFASVDIPTGTHICNELLLNFMKGRTRIVVTQPNPARLRNFDRLLLVEGGRVVASGPPGEVMESTAFQKLMGSAAGGSDTGAGEKPAMPAGAGEEAMATAVAQQKRGNANNEDGGLRETEAPEVVSGATILWWLRCAGGGNLAFFVIMILVQRIAVLRESLSLAQWIDEKSSHSVDDGAYMLSVLKIVLLACLTIALTTYAASRVSISASTRIHAAIVQSILRAPIDRFFDKQPVGRLINRLSFDMRQVDDSIPFISLTLLTFIAGLFVTQAYILSVVPTQILFVTVPFYFVLCYFIWLYRGAAVPLVFHSKFALSNLQDLQATVLASCVSIRVNGMFDDFMMRYNHQMSCIIRCQYLIFHVCKAWVQSRVFLVFSTLMCLFAIGGLWTSVPLGTLATVISMAFSQMTEFEQVSLMFTNFLNVLNSLQRLAKYLTIPQEGEVDMPGDPVVRLRAWVEAGELAELEVLRGSEAKACLEKAGVAGPYSSLAIAVRGKFPILQAALDGTSLELLPGCKLRDLAPGCVALRDIKDSYNIVGVIDQSTNLDEMAELLTKPPAKLWLDLWHSDFSDGIRIQMEDISTGYGSGKMVLKNISLEIEPRTKVGFAGQTGCGKSTTLLCILRILELRSGRMLIGGRDISKLGLSALRTMVGLVPQDPTIFEGSWKYNIDPFDEFPEGRIWEVLRTMQLLPFVRGLRDGIDSDIAKDGSNLSFGQRQLLSLARMVIRQPPVLLLDECTSALDPSTQEACQSTLLNDFPLSTVIAIAHRVETILDFDQIVVLSEGQLAEIGTVKEVLEIQDGIFAGMVNAHGKVN